MPKTIRPTLSKDMLEPFDSDITSIVFQEDCLEVYIKTDCPTDMILFDEKDLERMLNFIRVCKEKK